jgi:phage baseplate assembly protein W
MEYYKLPISFTDFFQKKELSKCDSLKESIGANIELLLKTSFGECAFDESFGCSIWENDFENIFSPNQWRDKIAQSLRKSITDHEPRLTNVQVSTNINMDEVQFQNGNSVVSRLKRRIDVRVQGNIVATNEPFDGIQKLFISPIALD